MQITHTPVVPVSDKMPLGARQKLPITPNAPEKGANFGAHFDLAGESANQNPEPADGRVIEENNKNQTDLNSAGSPDENIESPDVAERPRGHLPVLQNSHSSSHIRDADRAANVQSADVNIELSLNAASASVLKPAMVNSGGSDIQIGPALTTFKPAVTLTPIAPPSDKGGSSETKGKGSDIGAGDKGRAMSNPEANFKAAGRSDDAPIPKVKTVPGESGQNRFVTPSGDKISVDLDNQRRTISEGMSKQGYEPGNKETQPYSKVNAEPRPMNIAQDVPRVAHGSTPIPLASRSIPLQAAANPAGNVPDPRVLNAMADTQSKAQASPGLRAKPIAGLQPGLGDAQNRLQAWSSGRFERIENPGVVAPADKPGIAKDLTEGVRVPGSFRQSDAATIDDVKQVNAHRHRLPPETAPPVAVKTLAGSAAVAKNLQGGAAPVSVLQARGEQQALAFEKATPESFMAPLSEQSHQTSVARAAEVLLARPEAARLIALQMADAMFRAQSNKVEISLNPKELGRVRMVLTTTDIGVSVAIIADRIETLDLMRRHIDQLAEEFRNMGYDNIGFEFSEGDSQEEEADTPSRSESGNRPTTTNHQETNDPDQLPTARVVQSSGLDLRV